MPTEPPLKSLDGDPSHLSEEISPDAFIARLGRRPSSILNYMIPVPDEPIKPTIVPRSLAPSSVGLLDILPIELLHIIFNSLDFQSVSRFARACHQAKTLVESLLSYRDMMKHASTALITLSRSKLIAAHSAATIHAALLSSKCVSCQNFGPFLFLPTCERCCYECLLRERSLRAITLKLARTWFGVSEKDLGQIRTMLSITEEHSSPQMWQIDSKSTDQSPIRLVSLKQAEKLAISVHGSQEAVDRFGIKEAKKLGSRGRELARRLASSILDPDRKLSPLLARGFDNPISKYCRVASISFPSLGPNGELEKGLWCSGCRTKAGKYPQISKGPANQARSRSEFLEHIKDCEPARDLLRKTEEDDKTQI